MYSWVINRLPEGGEIMIEHHYQLVEDIDINEFILATHGIMTDKIFHGVLTSPDFTSEVLTAKEEMKLLSKYAKTGKQFLSDDLHLTESDFERKIYGVILGITGWITVDFNIEHVNEPHTFGDYFIELPPMKQRMYFIDYQDAVHQAKRMVTVFRKPWKIFQENGEKPLLIDNVKFTPGHPIDAPMSDGYDTYAVPVYLYMIYL